MIEVESKYLIADPTAFQELIVERHQCCFLRRERQEDTYFQHPAHDFRTTDEALRVRECEGSVILCYKGPRLDAVTKTRQELECVLSESSTSMIELLEALGFTRCGSVKKLRLVYSTPNYPAATIAVDCVENLGNFVEIEMQSTAADRKRVTAELLECAATFGLKKVERRSYLELLGKQGDRGSSPQSDR